ncbi:MAG: hypothetical protein KDA24_29235 [Deltaproteobacteria bacterium]|nr:hypothetical protein [Deltaproteobacteria bacterium]
MPAESRLKKLEAWLDAGFANAWEATQALSPDLSDVPHLDTEPVFSAAAELLGVSRSQVDAVRTAPQSREHSTVSVWSSDVDSPIKGDFSVREERQSIELDGALRLVWLVWDVGDNTVAARVGAGFGRSVLRVASMTEGWAVALPTSGRSVALMCPSPMRSRIEGLIQEHAQYVTRHASEWDLSEVATPERFEALARKVTRGGDATTRVQSDGSFEVRASRGKSQTRVRYVRWADAQEAHLSLVHLTLTVPEQDVALFIDCFHELLADARPHDDAWIQRQVRLMRRSQHAQHGSAKARAEAVLATQPDQVDAALVTAMSHRNTRSLQALSAEARAGYGPQLVQGILHFERSRHAEALPFFEAALVQAPDDYCANAYLGLALAGMLPDVPPEASADVSARALRLFERARAHPLGPEVHRIDLRAHANLPRIGRRMSIAATQIHRATGNPQRSCTPCTKWEERVGTEPVHRIPSLDRLVEINPTTGDHQHAFYRCHQCGLLYGFHKTYEYDPAGSFDEVSFWRLPPESQVAIGPILDPRSKPHLRDRALVAALRSNNPTVQCDAALAAWVLATRGVIFTGEMTDSTVDALGAMPIQTITRAASTLSILAGRHPRTAASVRRSLDRPNQRQRSKPGRHYAKKVAEACEVT